MASIVALPVIRGYYWIGEDDALTHLGFARDIQQNLIDATDIRYPIVHILGTGLNKVTNFPLEHSLLLVYVFFVISFFIFVTLSTKEIIGTRFGVFCGLFSSFLLLPINHLSGHMYIHPTSQAIMYFPVLLFVLIASINRPNKEFSLLLFILFPLFVLLHPQQAANIAIFATAITVLQFIYNYKLPDEFNLGRGLLYSVAITHGIIFWLWVQDLPAFEHSLGSAIVSLLEQRDPGSSVADRQPGLEVAGGTLLEVFLKSFTPAVIFSVFSSMLMIVLLLKLYTLSGKQASIFRNSLISTKRFILSSYLCIGLIATTPIFILYVIGGIRDQYFRHYAFLMVLVTIIGAVAISMLFEYIYRIDFHRSAKFSALIIFSILFIIVVPIFFASPYIYLTSNHVTEAQMSGYKHGFEKGSDDLNFSHVTSEASRYGHGINGVNEQERTEYYREGRGVVPDGFNDQNLSGYYPETEYLVISEADRSLTMELQQGYRFTNDDFRYIQQEQIIHKIFNNGGIDTYIVRPE